MSSYVFKETTFTAGTHTVSVSLYQDKFSAAYHVSTHIDNHACFRGTYVTIQNARHAFNRQVRTHKPHALEPRPAD